MEVETERVLHHIPVQNAQGVGTCDKSKAGYGTGGETEELFASEICSESIDLTALAVVLRALSARQTQDLVIG